MKIAICDDMLSDRAALSEMLTAYFENRGDTVLEICGYDSAEEFLNSFSDGKFQIIFMDIYLGGNNDVEAAHRIRERDSICAIIFITTSSDHAIDSYAVHASDYILKPFSQSDVFSAMDWCMAEYNEKHRTIEIVSGREHRSILINDIIYIEVMGRECVIHTQKGSVNTNRSLGDIEASLSDSGFLRCHRSYLLNMSYILRPDKNDFIIKNGDHVPISTDNLTKIKQKYYDWSFESTWEE